MRKKRALYDCSHARVKGERILCRKDHPFSLKTDDGSIDVKRLARGEPLQLDICQGCADFDSMGPPVPEEERGWLKQKEVAKHVAAARETLREAVAAGRR